MREISNRPALMSYYEKILDSSFRIDELKEIKAKGKKIIGYFCNFIPEELLYAVGVTPLRLCSGIYETISRAEEIFPRDTCPLIKSSLGGILLGISYFNLCDLIIVPTTCDGKMKLGNLLSVYLPVWILQVPHIKDIKTAKTVWLNEIRNIKEKLEKFTNVRINRDNLKQSIKKLHKKRLTFRKIYELRKYNPQLINGRDFMLIIQTSFYDDVDRWIEKTNLLYDELNQKAKSTNKSPTSSPRLLITGAPIIWPNYKILNIVEELGAVIVADELCSGTRMLYDLIEVDEWTEEVMLRAIANRYFLPSTCPCFVESTDRINKILNLVNEFNVEGVIYHSLRLCQLYDIESYKVRETLKRKKIPMLNIHTDYSKEDVEQIKTRVEAFLEMIKSQKNDYSRHRYRLSNYKGSDF